MQKITVSAPGKIHLLGEHSVVYGKPAILSAINLRVTVTISPYPLKSDSKRDELLIIQKVIEPIIKKHLKIKKIPTYYINLVSQIPFRSGLGSSAAASSAYIAGLLSYLNVKWDLNLINNLTFEAEKTFHGNPSGADNTTVTFGGLIWFQRKSPDLKIIQPLTFPFPDKISKNMILINTGQPKHSTKEMVTLVANLFQKQPALKKKFLDSQENLVQQLLTAIKLAEGPKISQIIRKGQSNLESIGVVSQPTQQLIRSIERNGGAAKICGAGSKSGPSGIVLAYHPEISQIIQLVKSCKLPYFKISLAEAGLRIEV